MKTDIQDSDDVEIFVNSFYKKIALDGLLAPVFNSKFGPMNGQIT